MPAVQPTAKANAKAPVKAGAKAGKPGEETPGDADSPLLDMSDVGVRKMIAKAKTRGYVTYDELNKVLPSDKVSSEQIEDTMSMLNEMGINVIESEEQEEGADDNLPAVPEGGKEVTTKTGTAANNMTAPTIRCACICARWARSSCSPAKAKSPSPSASRPAAS